MKEASRDRCDVHADASLFLGETPTMNFRTARGRGSCDAALSGHN